MIETTSNKIDTRNTVTTDSPESPDCLDLDLTNPGSIDLADVSQFLVGSDTLKLTPFFIKQFTIPGIAFSHITLNNRSGVALNVGSDTIDFAELSLEVMLDAGYKTYFELMDIAMQEVDHERATYATPEFDLWVQVLNKHGNPIFVVDFKNCRIQSVGDLMLDPSAELGATVQVSIVYDYWEYRKSITKPNRNSKIINIGSKTNNIGSKTNNAGSNKNEQNLDTKSCCEVQTLEKQPKRWVDNAMKNIRY